LGSSASAPGQATHTPFEQVGKCSSGTPHARHSVLQPRAFLKPFPNYLPALNTCDAFNNNCLTLYTSGRHKCCTVNTGCVVPRTPAQGSGPANHNLDPHPCATPSPVPHTHLQLLHAGAALLTACVLPCA
jgi:hypothetical protein